MNYNRSTEVRHFVKPMLCGALACVKASVLAFLKQGSSLQQCLIAGVVETAVVYAKMAHNGTRLNCVAVKNADNFQNSKQMENTEKYRIVDNEGNEVLADVSVSLLDFIQEVKHMMGLYGASSYTRAEQTRDKLAEQLDDIMRLGNER